MNYATITNRANNYKARVALKGDLASPWITNRQFNAALRRIGAMHQPIRSDRAFTVYTDAGHAVGGLEQYDDR